MPTDSYKPAGIAARNASKCAGKFIKKHSSPPSTLSSQSLSKVKATYMSLECALTTLTLLPIAHDLISSDDDDDDDDGVHDDQSYTSVASVTSFAGSQLTSNLNDETSMSISAHLAIDDQVFYRVGGKKK